MSIDGALHAHEHGAGDDVCRSPEAYYEFITGELADDGDGLSSGMGYEPEEAARLCAIQRMFVRLYAACE
jgi:hypothetical protein